MFLDEVLPRDGWFLAGDFVGGGAGGRRQVADGLWWCPAQRAAGAAGTLLGPCWDGALEVWGQWGKLTSEPWGKCSWGSTQHPKLGMVNIIGPTTSLDVAQDYQIFHALGKCWFSVRGWNEVSWGIQFPAANTVLGIVVCLFSHFWPMGMSWNWVDHITMSKPEISHIFGSERFWEIFDATPRFQ